MTAEARDTTPPDYASVPNNGLREFLQRQEILIQQNPDPIDVTRYRFEQFRDFGIPLVGHATRIANMLRGLDIIKAAEFPKKIGRVTYIVHKFDLWERRALSCFYWTYGELPFQQNTFIRDFPERVTLLREALGNHPLASYIHDPIPVEVDHHILSSPKRSRGIILTDHVHQDPDKIALRDSGEVSLGTLQRVLQQFRPEEIVDPTQIGLTDHDKWEIVQKAGSLSGGIDAEADLPVSRLLASVEMLQRPHIRKH